jgi:hypothetical protein
MHGVSVKASKRYVTDVEDVCVSGGGDDSTRRPMMLMDTGGRRSRLCAGKYDGAPLSHTANRLNRIAIESNRKGVC